jgi:hypothetical protein
VRSATLFVAILPGQGFGQMKQNERKELKNLIQERDDIAKIIDDFERLKKRRSERIDAKPLEGKKEQDSAKKLKRSTRARTAGA